MINNKQKTIRSVHYLGSKLRMLEAVKLAIDKAEPSNGILCDLFSGSGTVSKFMNQSRDVISVDIQEYSKVLCEATMSHTKNLISIDSIERMINDCKNTSRLLDCFSPLLNYENICMEKAQNNDIANLYEIIENGSLYVYMHNENDILSSELEEAIKNCCERLKSNGLISSEDSMISRYYGGLYFSYKQAVMMDCISHIVFEQNGILKSKMLAALLSTASEVVNTVGKQFAQPLKVKNSKGELKISLKNKILLDRSLNVFEIYNKWLSYYFSVDQYDHNFKGIRADFVDALDSIKDSGVSIVYADPPYTRYHYSRYYHVLETMCLRDNPKVSTTFPNNKGGISRAIYREDRHQSPFCIKSQAENAFELLFQKVSSMKVPLVLSYSPFDSSKTVTPRLQTIDQLLSKANCYFSSVNVVSPGLFTHSKLNSTIKNFETNHEAELLILCN